MATQWANVSNDLRRSGEPSAMHIMSHESLPLDHRQEISETIGELFCRRYTALASHSMLMSIPSLYRLPSPTPLPMELQH